MKYKILFILHIPPPVNGAAMVGKFLKESHSINKKFNADYINLTTSFDLDKIGKNRLSKISTILKIQLSVVRALLNNSYDLCYMTLTASGPGFYKDFLVICVLKLFGKKIIYHFHNKGVEKNSKNIVNRILYRFVFRGTRSIQLSPLLYYDIERYVKRENVDVCPNGIPISAKEVQQKKGNSKSPCTFLFLSNMMQEKGVFILLESCKILLEQGLDFKCFFVGAWSEVSESDFKKMVDENNLGFHIFAVGPKYGDDKRHYFEKSHVFIFPTYYHNESFPLVNLEAMQYSLPIISTYEGGIPDMVKDRVTGLLVPQKNSVELAKKMAILIRDPKLRIEMGKAGKERFKTLFTLAAFEENMSRILKQTIEKA